MRARFCPLLTALAVLTGAASGMVFSEATSLAAPAVPSGSSTGVQVRCATEQADIFIDGDQAGRTPLAEPLPLKAGEHTVRVARLGFTPFIDVFKVKAGQITKLDVELVPISGVLHITTPSEVPPGVAQPSGATIRVFVDDKYMGKPPLETELSIGSHTVRIERGGYYPDTFTASAVAGQTVEHEVVWKPLPADQNPYAQKGQAPTKWYQKWWVWTLGAVGVAAIATAVIVPIVVTQNNSLCNKVDVCATPSTLMMMPAALKTATGGPGGIAAGFRF